MNVRNTKYPDNLLGELGIGVNESTTRNLNTVLDELDTDKRRLIDMRYKYRMSYVEMSNVLGESKELLRSKTEHLLLKLMDKRNLIKYGIPQQKEHIK